MAVFRIEKNKDYTVMSNIHLKSKMSLKAKGMLSLMLSLPDNWDYSVKGLLSICQEGKDVIQKTLQELEEYGYLRRIRLQTKEGKFKYEYHIYEKPCTDFTITEPWTDLPCTVNPQQLNTNISNINISKDILNTKYSEKHKFGEYKRVKLTNEQYENLCKEFKKEFIDEVIKRLDEYVESNNNKNKYSNYNLVIRKAIKGNWFKINLRNDFKEFPEELG